MKQNEVLIIGCSPRKGGNTDHAALEVVRTARDMGLNPRLLYLRDYHILPCTGCHKCASDPDFKCILRQKDQCEHLLKMIDQARTACFCSPIYFYHLPAHLKGLIDRSQSFYERWIKMGPKEQSGKALCLLVAGRKQGESLFRGSLLTLKYFLDPFSLEIADLCLLGIDQKGDLEKDSNACSRIYDFVSHELGSSGKL